MKKYIKKNKEKIAIGILIIAIIVVIISPIIIKLKGQVVEANNLLIYIGTCIGALGTIFLGAITVYLNKKIEVINQRTLEIAYKKEIPNIEFNLKKARGKKVIKEYPKELNNTVIARLIKNTYDCINNLIDSVYAIRIPIFNKDISENSNENKFKKNVYFLTMINTSEITINSLKLLEVYFWKTKENTIEDLMGNWYHEGCGSKLDTKYTFEMNKNIEKNKFLIISIETISNRYKNKTNSFGLMLKFKIGTLNGYEYKQPISIYFKDNEISNINYLPIEPIINERE